MDEGEELVEFVVGGEHVAGHVVGRPDRANAALRAAGLVDVAAAGCSPVGGAACDRLETATVRLVRAELLAAGLADDAEIVAHLAAVDSGELDVTFAPLISAAREHPRAGRSGRRCKGSRVGRAGPVGSGGSAEVAERRSRGLGKMSVEHDHRPAHRVGARTAAEEAMNITRVPGQVVESVLSIGGIRVGTEEPHFLRRPLTKTVEIRRYGPRIAAETTVEGDAERARDVGFRRLARYIFGGNHRAEGIAMTAPVAQQKGGGDEIAMTAPVAQSREGDGGWTIRFFMPSKWTLDTLPTPDDDGVRLVTVPGQTVAVLRFSGSRSARAVTARTEELLGVLRDNDIETVGDAMAWFYDPPWTLPFRRRNEIAVGIAHPADGDQRWSPT